MFIGEGGQTFFNKDLLVADTFNHRYLFNTHVSPVLRNIKYKNLQILGYSVDEALHLQDLFEAEPSFVVGKHVSDSSIENVIVCEQKDFGFLVTKFPGPDVSRLRFLNLYISDCRFDPIQENLQHCVGEAATDLQVADFFRFNLEFSHFRVYGLKNTESALSEHDFQLFLIKNGKETVPKLSEVLLRISKNPDLGAIKHDTSRTYYKFILALPDRNMTIQHIGHFSGYHVFGECVGEYELDKKNAAV